MSKQADTFQLNTYELPRRAGEMKEYVLDIPVKEKFGVDLIAVPAGEFIEIQELYNYEPTNERGKRKKKQEETLEDLEIEDELMMDGDIMNLETPIRDAVVLSLPINPLCDQDCLGLCPECGGKWAELPEDHAHEVIDARWAGLGGLNLEDPDFKI
jgi:uncharacterized protein